MANLLNFKEKELERFSNLIQEYTDNIKELEEQEKTIDEKYRRLAEQEKKDLKEALDYYRGTLSNFVKERDSLLSGIKQETSIDEPVPMGEWKQVDEPAQVKKETPAVVEEKVVDTIFPENNVEEPEKEEKIHVEVEDNPFQKEEVEEKPEKVSDDELDAIFGTEEKKEEEQPAVEDFDDFPEIVEEWN